VTRPVSGAFSTMRCNRELRRGGADKPLFMWRCQVGKAPKGALRLSGPVDSSVDA
jgi:hypothetical protein